MNRYFHKNTMNKIFSPRIDLTIWNSQRRMLYANIVKSHGNCLHPWSLIITLIAIEWVPVIVLVVWIYIYTWYLVISILCCYIHKPMSFCILSVHSPIVIRCALVFWLKKFRQIVSIQTVAGNFPTKGSSMTDWHSVFEYCLDPTDLLTVGTQFIRVFFTSESK